MKGGSWRRGGIATGVRSVVLVLLAVLVVVSGGLMFPGMALADPQVHKLTSEDLSGWLDGVVPTLLERDSLPGATVVVVHDSQVVALRGYRASDRAWAIPGAAPVDPVHQLFRAGSVSKVFTVTAVMQQVQQGRLDLDTDVRRYLDFPLELPKGPDQKRRDYGYQ
jgi:CubicO group peptidase (beta-lactamase class C family)